VLLPAEAERWSEEQRRLVLLHELTHVTRRDCLTQMLAQVACAFYWFNPFIWSAARLLRVERSLAGRNAPDGC
jgi:beta-lactamase regulating signal transducer with metallopeptidase domain